MKSSRRDETCLCCSRGLDSLSGKSKSPGSVSLPLEGVILSLQDLIFYFRPPEEELEHEEKQTKLRSLRNRQNLFQEEVICMLHVKPQTLSDYSNLLIFALRSYTKNSLCKGEHCDTTDHSQFTCEDVVLSYIYSVEAYRNLHCSY